MSFVTILSLTNVSEKRFEAPSLNEIFFSALRRRGLDAPGDDKSLTEPERKKALRKA